MTDIPKEWMEFFRQAQEQPTIDDPRRLTLWAMREHERPEDAANWYVAPGDQFKVVRPETQEERDRRTREKYRRPEPGAMTWQEFRRRGGAVPWKEAQACQ